MITSNAASNAAGHAAYRIGLCKVCRTSRHQPGSTMCAECFPDPTERLERAREAIRLCTKCRIRPHKPGCPECDECYPGPAEDYVPDVEDRPASAQLYSCPDYPACALW